jgi:hypothetical protein
VEHSSAPKSRRAGAAADVVSADPSASPAGAELATGLEGHCADLGSAATAQLVCRRRSVRYVSRDCGDLLSVSLLVAVVVSAHSALRSAAGREAGSPALARWSGNPKASHEISGRCTDVQNVAHRRTRGRRIEYQDGGPHLLSAVIAEVTHQTRLDYAQRVLFEPIDIHTRPTQVLALGDRKR